MIWTKATSFRVAFCFLLLSTGGVEAAEKSNTQRLIDSAQKLFLQKDRHAAIAKLKAALSETTLSKKDRDQITDTLHQIVTLFLTDKGQKIFELARTQLYVNPSQTLKQIKEVRQLEDGNLAVELLTSRALILQKDCSEAQKVLEVGEDLWPGSIDVFELNLTALMCDERYDDLDVQLKRRPISGKSQSPIVKLAVAKLNMYAGEPQKALDVLREGPDSGHPEVIYQIWKIGTSLGLEMGEKARRYVSLCKTPTMALRQKFVNSPEICLRLSEVEAYLKAEATDSGEGV